MIQYAIWDKIKELSSLMPIQVTNLAKFVGNVILSKGLPLSVLKVITYYFICYSLLLLFLWISYKKINSLL